MVNVKIDNAKLTVTYRHEAYLRNPNLTEKKIVSMRKSNEKKKIKKYLSVFIRKRQKKNFLTRKVSCGKMNSPPSYILTASASPYTTEPVYPRALLPLLAPKF